MDYPYTFEGLLRLVARLRAHDGCPWDREQTPNSMGQYILEEAYELLGAIDESDCGKVTEELGDVMFLLAFQIQLGQEGGEFDARQVFSMVINKMVKRHPHVFGDSKADDVSEAKLNWHAAKSAEKGNPSLSVLDGVPMALPSLALAQMLQERAALAGFDWEDIRGVTQKISEEIGELIQAESPSEKTAELGDILFSVANLARWLQVGAEDALRKADSRFRRRFEYMEKLCSDRGTSFNNLPMSAKETLWQEAKKLSG